MNSKAYLFGILVFAAVPAADAADGKTVFENNCIACHGTGIAGAPKVGDVAAWGPRIKSGTASLYNSALNGKNAMPAKGGNPGLGDADVKAAVDYMVAQTSGAKPAVAKSAPQPAAAKTDTAAASARPAPAASSSPTPTVSPVAITPIVAAQEANTFNRLLRSAGKRNLPPPEDGIHDPTNDGTFVLQPPAQAFTGFPKSNAGNGVNWVETLHQKKIQPRYDRKDANAQPVVMDLNIVREVKGSMPDVVYPHKQHTEWLDCSNCHPAIFIPQKGANQISMAAILLGQKCGVCHGKVAFPVSECRLCHSKKKETAVTQTGTK